MQAVVIIGILVFIVGAALAGGYYLYRRGLRYAKGIERGIKMVPILINLPPPSEDAEVSGRDVRDVIQERISQAEVLYNLIASTATKGFKSKFFGQRHIAFEMVAIDGVIRFYAAVPVAMVAVIKQAVLTAYPGANLEEVEDHNIFSESGKISGTYGGEIKLKSEYAYPIATFDQLKRDTIQGLINSLTSLEEGDGAGIQILLRPAREGWMKNSESLAKKKRENKEKSGFSFKHVLQAPFKVPEGGDDKEGGGSPPKQMSNIEQTAADAIEEKAKSAGYEVLIRVIASSNTASRSQAITNNIVSSFSLFDAPGLNGFKFEAAKNMERFVTDFIFRSFPPERHQMILNSVELSTLFHFPDAQFTQTTKVQRQYSKQIEGPSQLSQEGMIIGYNVYRGVKKQIRLSDNDRRRHIYIVGQTGTGKSVLLENMMVQDMQAGKGFAFIDPHGDAAETILGMIPKERSEDVIYFDPGSMENPPGLNLFEYHTEDQKDFLIQEALNMLYKLYDPQQQGIIGPRYEHLFRNAALTVMADPNGGTFIDIPKLFRDPQFVKEKLKHVEDKTVLEFWQKEMPQSQRSSDFGEIVSWFVSKFGAFLSNQMMRNIIGQPKSAFDLRDVMDNRKILIANLSKGRLGELNSMLLGMIFVMKFQAAAMSRASQPESERVDFSFYIDEFQNFSTESFAFILSEARKYHLNMIVANQYISQLSEEVREAVFGNVGTIISLRTGPNDADFLVKQFSPVFNDRDLVNLPNYHAAVRLMSQGLPSQPFSLVTLPPIGENNPKLAEALKQLSDAKYGRPRQEVEDEIFDRLSTKPAPNPYESLATSKSGDSSEGSASKPASGSGQSDGSSFLDEWLAKRRQSMQQQGGRPSGQSPQAQPPQQGTGSLTHGNKSSVRTNNAHKGGRMTSNQSENTNMDQPNQRQENTHSGQASSQSAPQNTPPTSGGQQPSFQQQGDGKQYVSGADANTPPVSGDPQQPASPGTSSTSGGQQHAHSGSNPYNSEDVYQTHSAPDSSSQGQSNTAAHERTVEPPEDRNDNQAREALLAALNDDEKGGSEGQTASNEENAPAEHADAAPAQRPPNQGADYPPSGAHGQTGQTVQEDGTQSSPRSSAQMDEGQTTNNEQPLIQPHPDPQPPTAEPENTTQSAEEVSSGQPPSASEQPPETPAASANTEEAAPGETVTPEASQKESENDTSSAAQTTNQSVPSEAQAPQVEKTQTEQTETEDTNKADQNQATVDQEEAQSTQSTSNVDSHDLSQQVASDLGVALPESEPIESQPGDSGTSSAPNKQPSQENAAPTSSAASQQTSNGIPNLQPGEIYIDEEGNVHRG